MPDIRGIKPLSDLTPEALSLFGILLLFLALAFLAFRLLSVRNQEEAVSIERRSKRTPSIRQRLDLLRAKESISPEAFCAALSEIMRDFLRVRYGILCRRLTTTEIIQELAKKEVPAQVSNLLAEILRACDLVKFAAASPHALELQQQITSATLVLEYSNKDQKSP